MPNYLYLMHNDAAGIFEPWDGYLRALKTAGHLVGGSAIGDGVCVNKSGPAPGLNTHLSGFIRIAARDLAEAPSLLAGNTVFEAGGTIEIRELPKTR